MARLVSLATAGLLLATVYAAPNPLEPRATDAALEPWVTVNESGKPSTVTPVLSTISGTPTIISPAPHDITATVFTVTSIGKKYTSTGEAPPDPTAASNDQGSFAICHNLDKKNAPWCKPTGDEPLYVGTTYYFTWDPVYFNSSRNATVKIVGNHINKTSGEIRDDSPAFVSSPATAGLGFTAIDITSNQLLFQGAQDISTLLIAVIDGKPVHHPGPNITITHRPGPVADARGHLPQGAALAIALPVIFGLVALCAIGTCMYNRHRRRIEVTGVMGRNYDVSKTSIRSRFRLGKRGKKANKAHERIELMKRDISAEGGDMYHDFPNPGPISVDRPRRDSEALDSLAGSPTEDRRMELGRPGEATGNTFRDELKRQENERS